MAKNILLSFAKLSVKKSRSKRKKHQFQPRLLPHRSWQLNPRVRLPSHQLFALTQLSPTPFSAIPATVKSTTHTIIAVSVIKEITTFARPVSTAGCTVKILLIG